MKIYTLVAIAALSATTLLAGNPPGSGKGEARLEKLKSLVGEWQGKDEKGNQITLSYKLVSDGKTLMESMGMGEHKESMVTIYHLNGDQLMLTHYCSAGNQPRMRVKEAKDEHTLAFSFIDATNLTSPEDAHMRSVVFTFQDNDHFTQEWTMRSKGKDAPPMEFAFERVKSGGN